MKKFVCPVCGYVYEGDEMPADFHCPVCKVPGSKFVEQTGEMKLAAEHEFGIYEKTVANNPDISAEDKAYILEQLKANFTGECSEVGMYLCMARIAHREGYPLRSVHPVPVRHTYRYKAGYLHGYTLPPLFAETYVHP